METEKEEKNYLDVSCPKCGAIPQSGHFCNDMYSEKEEKIRTSQMNRAFHLLLSQVAKEMQAQGIDQRTVLSDLKGYNVPVTDTFLKEVWRSIMVTMFRKTSTTQLTTKEMKDCYDVFQKFVAENYNLEAPWPSLEQMMMSQLELEQYQ